MENSRANYYTTRPTYWPYHWHNTEKIVTFSSLGSIVLFGNFRLVFICDALPFGNRRCQLNDYISNIVTIHQCGDRDLSGIESTTSGMEVQAKWAWIVLWALCHHTDVWWQCYWCNHLTGTSCSQMGELMHGWLLGVTFCLSVCPSVCLWLDNNSHFRNYLN